MEQKLNVWLLRLIRIGSCENREASYVCLYGMTRDQVMDLVEDEGYTKDYDVVCVFKLEDVFGL